MSQNLEPASRLPLVVIALILCATIARAETWIVVPSGEQHDLKSITMVDNKYGYATGANGSFTRTTNGGQTWIQQRLTVTFTKTMACAAVYDTASFATAVGDNGELVMMFPASTSWQSITIPTEDLSSVCYRQDSIPTCVYVGTNGFIGQTQVHSRTYTVYDPYGYPLYDTTEFFTDQRVLQTPTQANLRAVVFNVSHGIVVGDSAHVLLSSDRGETWTEHIVGPVSVSLRSLALLPTGTLVAVGTQGTIIRSTDGGATWHSVAPPTFGIDLYGVAFSDGQRGFAVGDGGCIMQTSDGGVTWVRVGVNTIENLRGAYALPSTVGSLWVAVGDTGTVVMTLYGGMPVSFTTDKNAVAFGDVAVGQKRSDNISFTNTNTESYVTVRMQSTDSRVTISPSTLILDPGATGKIRATFAPTDTGAVSVALAFISDTGWVTDTMRATGRGVAAYARFGGDTITIDTALEGRSGDLTIFSVGNLPLTANVTFVSDTNLDVSCIGSADAGDSIPVTAVVKHTLYRSIDAFAVVQTNAYRRDPDTIRIIAAAAERVSVPEQPMLVAFQAHAYPNPLPANATGTLMINAPASTPCVLRICDERGAVVREMDLGRVQGERAVQWAIPGAPQGTYLLQLLTPSGQAAGIRAAVR